MNTLNILANTIVFTLSCSLPFVCDITQTKYSVNTTFLIFHIGINGFILAWSFGRLHFLVRLGSILAVVLQTRSILFSLAEDNVLYLGTFFIAFYLTCYNHDTSNWICSAKTVFFDWLVLILMIITSGFADIMLRTDTFTSLLGFFFGSNIFGLVSVKGSQFMWERASHLDTQDPNEATCIYTYARFG